MDLGAWENLYARARLGTWTGGPSDKPSRAVLSAPRARVKGRGITSVTNHESVFLDILFKPKHS